MNKHWKQGQYSFDYLTLATGLQGSTGWDKGGYNAMFNGITISKGHRDVIDAKKAVEEFAEQYLTKALNKLRGN